MVLGLIFKGMNDFCQREIVAYSDCRDFYAKKGAAERAGVCGREREMMGTCRMLASDSIAVQCTEELTALTLAVGHKRGGEEVQQLTDRLYQCGLTPAPGLATGEPRRLPGRFEEGVLEVLDMHKKRQEFVKVVTKQLSEQHPARMGVVETHAEKPAE